TSRIKYQEIYDYADFLIVHTQNAINILKELYKVNANKILYHPFPIIDLSLLRKHESKEHKKEQPNFLFIGVIRQEKGVQNLIDAWERLGPSFPAQLHIAGFKPDDVQIDTNKINNFPNVKLTIRSLSDMEYFDAVD